MESSVQARNREARQQVWLDAYRQSGNVTHACRLTGVARSAVYDWRADEAFAAAMDDAGEEACDLMEIEAKRRAVDGVARLKFDKDGKPLRDPRKTPSAAYVDDEGNEVPATDPLYVELEYSDGLLMFLLRAHRPKKYRNNVDVTSGDQPLMKAYVGIDIDRV